MFQPGDHVRHKFDGATAVIESASPTNVTLRWDHSPEQVFSGDPDMLDSFESAPATSESTTHVDAALIRHARDAGTAIGALQVIRGEVHRAIYRSPQDDGDSFQRALLFIDEYINDILSSISSK